MRARSVTSCLHMVDMNNPEQSIAVGFVISVLNASSGQQLLVQTMDLG